MTPAEILAQGDTRERDCAARAARERLAVIADIALAAVKDAALAGNVTCRRALAEIIVLCPRPNAP